MTVPIRDIGLIKANSDALGQRYFENIDWKQIFRENDERNVRLAEL